MPRLVSYSGVSCSHAWGQCLSLVRFVRCDSFELLLLGADWDDVFALAASA